MSANSTLQITSDQPANDEAARLQMLRELERKVLWLSTWMIHHANHLRSHPGELKVGGHQASSASVVTLMTALYFDALRAQDRVAVKPHASPVFHAIQYLLGRQTRENLERFRALGGVQSYPSRTKDEDDVDFSTGSVGMGVAMTLFSSLVQDYLHCRGAHDPQAGNGRMVAVVGDAELDEGNVFESLFEGWKHDLRNVWWVIDYNRQSLDSVVEDQLIERVHQMFKMVDWNVVILKYGKQLQRAFGQPGGEALRHWIDTCPNSLYSALVYQGGSAWRAHLKRELGTTCGIPDLLDRHDDVSLHALMTNLAGHDMETVSETFRGVHDDQPTAFLAYTIKGHGLPLAGHKDNHAGLMSKEQMQHFQQSMEIPPGEEWDPDVGLLVEPEEIHRFIANIPFAQSERRNFQATTVDVPRDVSLPAGERLSTQRAFGRLLSELSRRDDSLAERIVTTSPDVTTSTNLSPWVSKRGVFHRNRRPNLFAEEEVRTSHQWSTSPTGQHIELGIAESNFFILLAALGLSGPHFGHRLIPIGTIYDPFISRGLDALNYACYQDARFLLVGTPSGITLAPEGGAHQSVLSPLIGIGQPNLTYFEPSYADELKAIVLWSFELMQADEGGAVYIRLSTRKIPQLDRCMTPELHQGILDGAYWLTPPQAGAETAIICSGAIVPEAIAAHRQLQQTEPEAGLLVVTSADRLYKNWIAGTRSSIESVGTPPSTAEKLLGQLSPSAELVTVIDGHPLTLSWLGSVRGQRVKPLGVCEFGQSGALEELYRDYELDEEAILERAVRPAMV